MTPLAKDTALTKIQKRDIFLLLAKASAGKDFTEQAVEYMRNVLDNDPGFQLNLDKEPRHVQNVWFKVSDWSPPRDIETIAVFYFENTSIYNKEKLDPFSKGIAAMLVHDFQRLSKLRVVERERIQHLLDEFNYQKADYFDDSKAVRVGKFLAAHTMLMGNFTQFDKNTIRIDARLVLTETGEIIKADYVEGKPKHLAKLQSELALKIAESLDVAVEKAEKEAILADGRQSLKAVLAYTRALNLEDEGKYAEASEAYAQALKADKSHEVARDRIEALAMVIVEDE